MHFTKKSFSQKREGLKNKLKKQNILKFPGAHNPLTAKLISEIGFDGIYISGAVTANDLGFPDIGITTLKEVSYRANQIARVSDLPSIVDADTGFDDCKKTIETFENLGLSGCHIEDQIDEKRCGHLHNKEIIPLDKMVNKIKTAVNAKKDKNFFIATSFVAVTAPFVCLPSICLWVLFGSSIKLIIKNTKIKKIIEYLLALLLVITAVIIVFD